MVAPTHCLIGVALIFSICSWVAGIIAMAVPKWYVVDTTEGQTDFGAFRLCVPSGDGEKTCESISSQSFNFPQCDRSSSAMRSRFGVVQGLGIVGIVLTVIATALLVAAFVMGCRKTRSQREEERIKRRNEPGYVPTPKNDPRPNHLRPASQRDDVDHNEHRMHIIELIALGLDVVGFAVFCAAAFHFLSSVKSWLFCDEAPCTYLESLGATGCSESIGWTFALALIAWITALAAALCLLIRWFLLPSAPAADPNSSEVVGAPIARHPDGRPTDEELRRREQNRDEYRQKDHARRKRHEEQEHERQQDQAYAHQQQQVYQNNAAIQTFTQQAYLRNTPSQPQQQVPPTSQVSANGAPQCTLPEGHWEWDADSQLFWSDEQRYFFDHNSGHFYEPESKQWFNPTTNVWYTI